MEGGDHGVCGVGTDHCFCGAVVFLVQCEPWGRGGARIFSNDNDEKKNRRTRIISLKQHSVLQDDTLYHKKLLRQIRLRTEQQLQHFKNIVCGSAAYILLIFYKKASLAAGPCPV